METGSRIRIKSQRRNHQMKKKIVKEFRNLREFADYLDKTPTSNLFKYETLDSQKTDGSTSSFTKTKSFEEAKTLMIGGWKEESAKLEQRIKLDKKAIENRTVKRMTYDVTGFQASVPRYLQGLPTNMMNKKNIIQKQKVITIVKHIGYLGNVTTDEIFENSLKALKIVKAIEETGIRVNLDVISPASTAKEVIICRVRIKSANERLNISKVAFPLIHPSMLRRMVFRFREVQSEAKDKEWTWGYGKSVYDREEAKSYLKKDEYYLHNFIKDIDEELKMFKK